MTASVSTHPRREPYRRTWDDMAIPSLERRQFKVGKYDILAQPAAGSLHMMRYTVMLNGKRLGALLSVPTESDCRFLEAPPPVPPLKIFQVTYRPGRPKKGTQRPNGNGEGDTSGPTIPWAIKNQQRY
jgi:hypothetical protein